MKQEGFHPVLKKFHGLLLKRQVNLTNKQRFRLRDLLPYNLRSVRAYLLNESWKPFSKSGIITAP